MNEKIKDMKNAILQAACANNGTYLLRNAFDRNNDAEWIAAKSLVDDGLAEFDRLSCYWPCIKLTEKAIIHP